MAQSRIADESRGRPDEVHLIGVGETLAEGPGSRGPGSSSQGPQLRSSYWWSRCARRGGALVASTAVVLGLAASLGGAPTHAAGRCPALQVYGAQGTGQSTTTADPDLDSGWLSQVLAPLNDGGFTDVDRKYIPYDAGFGGAVPGGSKPYSESVAGAVATGEKWIKSLAGRCPQTRLALVGYSQGAHAVKILAEEIVAGKLTMSPDRIAAVATFGDPTRPQGASLFPGAPGQTTPSAVPGTSGAMVQKLIAGVGATPSGRGVGPTQDTSDLSELAGRYASFCTPGDLACDAPSAPVLQFVTNVAGQSELNPDDPVAALSSIGQALALTTVKTAPTIINEDLTAPDNNLASLSYQPKESLSSRLAKASDPRTPLPTIEDGIKALWKIGTIGFNALSTVVRKVATPDTIGQVILAGAANPLGIIGVLAPKVGAAAVELVPPATTQRWVSEAFDSFKREFSDNQDLFTVTSAFKLFETAQAHGSYGTVAATPTGAPATEFVTEWLRAAAKDITSSQGGNVSTDTTEPGTPEVSATDPSTPETSGESSSTPSSDDLVIPGLTTS